MCGIGGIVCNRVDVRALRRMGDAMRHRGPDGFGVWTDSQVGFAHRRLAIIDLEHRSDQPMHLGPWHLIFNGEIYNYLVLRDELTRIGHKFQTSCDAEVLLHAWSEWDEHTLDKVNGMFALAIWNDIEQSLVLSTDPFGEKPLYWHQSGNELKFASDIRALAAIDNRIGTPNTLAVQGFLTFGFMPKPEESFFSAVNRLPAAHILKWKNNSLSVRRYWSPQPTKVPSSYTAAVDELRSLLQDSIRLRLRSDVPVGTSLSGGIDSSAIVSLAGTLAGNHRRHAFTASFPGFRHDEWEYAKSVATAAGVIEHHRVQPTGEELLDDLEHFVSDQEEPCGSSSVYAQWQTMRAAKEAGIVVLLDGQGGDELFAGYPQATGFALRSMGVHGIWNSWFSSRINRRFIAKSIGHDYLPKSLSKFYHRYLRSPYVHKNTAIHAIECIPEAPAWAEGFNPLKRELSRESFVTSLPQLLRYADRSSMAHSREVRLPLLDRRIAEFAFSLPAQFVLRKGLTKAILRDAVRPYVPARVLDRRDKIGFETPQSRWLSAQTFRQHIGEVLLDPRATSRGLCDTKAIEKELKGSGWTNSNAIWRAFNVELWLNQIES